MNIGVTFGGFCPLHQGHLDMIMRTKKENDLCIVFICGYENDRGGEILPLDKRFRIISNFLKDETMVFDKINDTALGLDESMSEENWKIWLECAYRKIDKIIMSMGFWKTSIYINWYVSEAGYKTQILNGAVNKEVASELLYIDEINCTLLDRTENPVSGTLCRTHPLKYWDKITAPFKAYYSHNILITGTASEGKTTLTRDIARYFGLPYSYEKGRDICKLKTEPEFTCKDYIYNLYEQHKLNEDLIASPQNPGIFISDTDNMVTLMYAAGHAGKPGFILSKEDYKILCDLAAVYSKTTKWDKIFLLKPSKKGIVDDGERYMPDSDYSIRYQYYQHLKSLYDAFGYEYEELEEGYYGNFCRVRDYIKDLYEKN